VARSALDQWQADGAATYLGSTDDVRPAISAADCAGRAKMEREFDQELVHACYIDALAQAAIL